jgi:hypothetical protein
MMYEPSLRSGRLEVVSDVCRNLRAVLHSDIMPSSGHLILIKMVCIVTIDGSSALADDSQGMEPTVPELSVGRRTEWQRRPPWSVSRFSETMGAEAPPVLLQVSIGLPRMRQWLV